MENKDYTFSFESSKSQAEIFETLLDVRKWWIGLYGEDIKGDSQKIGDEFTFTAGDGLHYTKQQLVELKPAEKLVWIVTESNLTFAKPTDEWTNTKLVFVISTDGNKSKVTFTHEGLVSNFNCYDNCASAWMQYMNKLATMLS